MVERASQVSLLKGLFVGREELEITYLQFEDDTRFFLFGEGQNLRSLLLIYEVFSLVSGLKINRGKFPIVGIKCSREGSGGVGGDSGM
jgi:hypothetical protein